MKILKTILNLPKTISAKYKGLIVKDANKTLKKACKTLDEYAADVLNIQINEATFVEVKRLYLDYAEHKLAIKEIVFSTLEILVSFIMAYVYIVVNKEDFFLKMLENTASFLIFFFVAFYFPQRIKKWCSKKSKIHKIIEGLTYLVYKNNK